LSIKRIKDFLLYIFYPSKTEKKAILFFVLMIITGDIYLKLRDRGEKDSEVLKIEKIDINIADFEDFVNIPGIGPRVAAKIIDYRDKKGRIYAPYELKNIRGVGDKRIEVLKRYFKFPEN